MTDFQYTEMLPLVEDDTPYRLITTDGVGEATLGDRTFLTVEPEALRTLAFAAVKDIQHLLRPKGFGQPTQADFRHSVAHRAKNISVMM